MLNPETENKVSNEHVSNTFDPIRTIHGGFSKPQVIISQNSGGKKGETIDNDHVVNDMHGVKFYHKKLSVENMDRSTKTAINYFTNFVLLNCDVKNHGDKHVGYLDPVMLHDTENYLIKKQLRAEEREIIRKNVFRTANGGVI